jgi:hypothetical protein
MCVNDARVTNLHHVNIPYEEFESTTQPQVQQEFVWQQLYSVFGYYINIYKIKYSSWYNSFKIAICFVFYAWSVFDL